MKIIQHTYSLLNLNDFGISIPLLDQRVKNITQHLISKDIELTSPTEWTAIDKEIISLAHNEEFCKKLFSDDVKERHQTIYDCYELINTKGEYHRYDPNKAIKDLDELITKNFHHVAGTIEAVKIAMKEKFCFFLGGGFHHSMSYSGRGFCLVNDIVIAAKWAQKNLKAKNVWIIDVDAHKGDGTAELTHKDSSIATLSIHMAKGWPLDEENKGQPWFIPNDIEIPIEENEQSSYLEKLRDGLNQMKNIFPKPDLAIIVQGADPCEVDQLPSADLLKLPLATMLERDKLVYNFFDQQEIPQAYVISGGYGDQVYQVYCQFLDWINQIKEN